MINQTLKEILSHQLKQADEIWIAVALIKDNGFSFIQKNIPFKCKQHYLVGIDLPTTPSVLKTILNKTKDGSLDCAIYKSEYNFHPKVYLIKSKLTYTAIIGSANLTDGGLKNNIELNYCITDQVQCLSILDWFNKLYNDAYPLSSENIALYENEFNKIEDIEEESKYKRSEIQLKRNDSTNPLEDIDFSDRFFKKEHHLAFRKELWVQNSLEANKERENAENRFLELHDIIYPQFNDYMLRNLDSNTNGNIVSRSHQIDPSKPRNLDAMWLSYGKSQPEIKAYQNLYHNKEDRDRQTFIHHTRLQIRIELKSIGIWILFGKENQGSIIDRDYFKTQMRSESYRNRFHSVIKSLPNDYWILVNDKSKPCNSFTEPDSLHEFCKKDDTDKYFIIGRDYNISDDGMSVENLPTEALKVFQRLYPIYDMMRHKLH